MWGSEFVYFGRIRSEQPESKNPSYHSFFKNYIYGKSFNMKNQQIQLKASVLCWNSFHNKPVMWIRIDPDPQNSMNPDPNLRD